MNTVLRWTIGPSARSGHALALVDLDEHRGGGHFGNWLRRFAEEFAKRFDDVYVVTPMPNLTRSRFQDAGGAPANVSFHRIPRRLRKDFDLAALRGIGSARRRNLSVFFMWGYDLLKLRPPREERPVPWAALTGTSWLRRAQWTPAASLEERQQSFFRSSSSCRAFLHWDEYLTESCGKAIWVPDMEDVTRPEQPTALAERIRSHGAGRFCVGAFGINTGMRCLNELLSLAQAQPGVRFVVAGQVMKNSVAHDLRPFLQEGALPNLLILPGLIPTEAELNDAIAAADAVLIDGKSYPIHSGIVCKAAEAGRCVITPRSNSWTSDFALKWGAGIVYESRRDALTEAWAQWKAGGGEARSRAASAYLRNPAAVAACFDRVSNALTKE